MHVLPVLTRAVSLIADGLRDYLAPAVSLRHEEPVKDTLLVTARSGAGTMTRGLP